MVTEDLLREYSQALPVEKRTGIMRLYSVTSHEYRFREITDTFLFRDVSFPGNFAPRRVHLFIQSHRNTMENSEQKHYRAEFSSFLILRINPEKSFRCFNRAVQTIYSTI
ncbi:hypothetical protein [uncultured Methanofollis sp.]|uniref:hypothetical protein n=1 Tax=uncultured Methanofollis sp. TaxID=262500 RepID=UPI002638050E|nr:hypothetical protein [uncultured Methanofollis sp.]